MAMILASPGFLSLSDTFADSRDREPDGSKDADGCSWPVKNERAGKVGKKFWSIEPAGEFHGGPVFKDSFDLRKPIATRQGDHPWHRL